MAIFGKALWIESGKYSARPITLSHDGILMNGFFATKAWDAGDADRGIARVNIATRALFAHTYQA
jgi:hypothetical protein